MPRKRALLRSDRGCCPRGTCRARIQRHSEVDRHLGALHRLLVGLRHAHRTVQAQSKPCVPRDAQTSAECACEVSDRYGGRAGGRGARLARRGRTCCRSAAYGLVHLGEGASLLDGFTSSNSRPAACGSRRSCQPWAGAAVEWRVSASHSPGSDMDHSAGASSEHLEARSELLLVTSLELAAAKGTVGKLSISAFRWRRQREPSEASLAISTAMDHVGKIVFHGKIPKLANKIRHVK